MSIYNIPAANAIGIENNNTNNPKCRAVYIGAAANYDLYINGSWVVFNGTTAGSLIPAIATGARHNTGSTAPDAGDIVFLY